jgi:fumarylacetoacetase
LNDWSARDIQQWEYVPLGPFLAKNFASCISPWIISIDALAPFRCDRPIQNDPRPLPYLQQKPDKANFDLSLEVNIQPKNSSENLIAESNFKYMYWSIAQQLAHHSINGCLIKAGDMMGSGTISGPDKGSYGSMLEIAWNGTEPIKLLDGEQRSFVQDYDTIILRAKATNSEIRIGFGDCASRIIPSKPWKKK